MHFETTQGIYLSSTHTTPVERMKHVDRLNTGLLQIENLRSFERFCDLCGIQADTLSTVHLASSLKMTIISEIMAQLQYVCLLCRLKR